MPTTPRQIPLSLLRPGAAFRMPPYPWGEPGKEGWKVEDIGGDVKVQLAADNKRELWSSYTMVYLADTAAPMHAQRQSIGRPRLTRKELEAIAAEVSAKDAPPVPQKLR